MSTTKKIVLQTLYSLSVPVFIYSFWNYFHYSDIFPGLLDLTLRVYLNFGLSMLTSVPFILMY